MYFGLVARGTWSFSIGCFLLEGIGDSENCCLKRFSILLDPVGRMELTITEFVVAEQGREAQRRSVWELQICRMFQAAMKMTAASQTFSLPPLETLLERRKGPFKLGKNGRPDFQKMESSVGRFFMWGEPGTDAGRILVLLMDDTTTETSAPNDL